MSIRFAVFTPNAEVFCYPTCAAPRDAGAEEVAAGLTFCCDRCGARCATDREDVNMLASLRDNDAAPCKPLMQLDQTGGMCVALFTTLPSGAYVFMTDDESKRTPHVYWSLYASEEEYRAMCDGDIEYATVAYGSWPIADAPFEMLQLMNRA